jgi:hypothetical protein
MRTFPERWWIVVTKENRQELHDWRLNQSDLNPNYKQLEDTKLYVLSEPNTDNSYLWYGSSAPANFGEKVSTEEWREHFLPKKSKFERGDVLEFLGHQLYYVGMAENGQEWAEHIEGDIGVSRHSNIPKDYVSMGRDSYWIVRPTESWELIKKKEKVLPIKLYECNNWLEREMIGQMGIYEQMRMARTKAYERSSLTGKMLKEMFGGEVKRGSNISFSNFVMDYSSPEIEAWVDIKAEIEPLPECIMIKKRKKKLKTLVV